MSFNITFQVHLYFSLYSFQWQLIRTHDYKVIEAGNSSRLGNSNQSFCCGQPENNIKTLSQTKKMRTRDFPGGPVVKNLPSNAGDKGSIPGQGTKIPHAMGQLSPCATTTEPTCSGARVPQLERSLCITTRKKPTCHN